MIYECILCDAPATLTGPCRGCSVPDEVDGRGMRRIGKSEVERLTIERDALRSELAEALRLLQREADAAEAYATARDQLREDRDEWKHGYRLLEAERDALRAARQAGRDLGAPRDRAGGERAMTISSLDYTDIPWVERLKRDLEQCRKMSDRMSNASGWDGTEPGAVNCDEFIGQIRAERDTLRAEVARLTAIVTVVATRTNGYWNSPHAPSATEDLDRAEVALHEIANAIGEPF